MADSAKKSLKEAHDVPVGSLGGGCVYISICSKDRQNERSIGKHMRKGTSRRAKCGAPTASALLSVALFSESTTVGKAIVGPLFGLSAPVAQAELPRGRFLPKMAWHLCYMLVLPPLIPVGIKNGLE